MELYLFFLLLSYANIYIVSTDLSDKKPPQILTIREKGSISLKCVFTGHEEVAWYHLSSYTLTLLISAQKSHAENSLPVYYNKYDSRFVLRPNSEITTAEFTIMNLTKEDLGVYFCGITAEPAQMHFGRATILQFEDKKEETTTETSSTQPAGEEVENKDKASACEKVLMFGGVGVATLLFILTTVVACTVIRPTKKF